MSYVALYRKFRPQTWDQVRGQDHVVQALKNQVKNNRIGHAYLFTGTRGTGKTSVAKLLARAVNCLDPKDGGPCLTCANCRAAMNDSFIDIVEMDAASNTGVDDIRRVIDEVQYAPVKGRYKVYIIDEVHMLSTSAFNAFLKTLEEPPAYAIFILATTEPHKLPITILSRCQRYDFRRISNEAIAHNLSEIVNAEGLESEEKALQYIARLGDGSMRDSISLLDKCIAFNLGGTITYENVLKTLGVVDTEVFSQIFRCVYRGDAAGALKKLEEAAALGKDLTQFTSDFIWYLRNLMLTKVNAGAAGDILGVSAENLAALEKDAQDASLDTLMRYIRLLSDLLRDIKYSATKQILIEVAFVRMARPDMETDTAALLDRVRQLEERPAVMAAPAQIEYAPGPDFYPQQGPYVEPQGYMQPQPYAQPHVEPQPYAEPYWQPELYAQPQTYMEPQAPLKETGAAKEQASRGGSITACWGDIISACQDMRLRIAMKKAAPVEDENGITIYSDSASSIEKIGESLDEIRQAIRKVCGVDAAVSFKEGNAPAKKAENAAVKNENDIFKNINFNIGTEDF